MLFHRSPRGGPRYLPFALCLGLLLAALAPLRTERYKALWLAVSNAGHLPLFGLFAIGLFYALPHRLAGRGRYVATAVISYLTVILIEIVQPLFGRTTSMEDAVNGMLGVALALGGRYLWRRRTAYYLRLGHAGLTLLILVWLFAPAWNEARVIVWSYQHFPVLGDFEDSVELRLWRAKSDLEGEPTSIRPSDQYVTAGRHSLEVRTGWGSWSGVRYAVRASDWRAFRELRFDVYNPGRPFHLRLRLEDAGNHGSEVHFVRRFDVQTGWNAICVSLTDSRETGQGRELDLRKITRLSLYTGEHEPAHVFYLDHVRLQ